MVVADRAARKSAAQDGQDHQIQQSDHYCQPGAGKVGESVEPQHPRQPERQQEDTGQGVPALAGEPEGADQQQRQRREIYPSHIGFRESEVPSPCPSAKNAGES
jgi:hypothetical protein